MVSKDHGPLNGLLADLQALSGGPGLPLGSDVGYVEDVRKVTALPDPMSIDALFTFLGILGDFHPLWPILESPDRGEVRVFHVPLGLGQHLSGLHEGGTVPTVLGSRLYLGLSHIVPGSSRGFDEGGWNLGHYPTSTLD
jgi:hypothetical protein